MEENLLKKGGFSDIILPDYRLEVNIMNRNAIIGLSLLQSLT